MELMYLRKSRADGEIESIEKILAKHERILQEYALKTYGYTIQSENILREIVSGETIQERPQMCKLLDRLQAGDISAVLVVDPQRLSRGDLRDCGTIVRAFQYTDTLISTPQKIYDLSDKFDRKFLEMELMRGNDYLEYIKEIMLRGRLASVNAGNYIGSGSPFGYDKVKDGKTYTLSENSESDAVRLIFELYANQGYGYQEICNWLDTMGIKPRKSNYWTPASIRDILSNPVYIGKIRWNWRKTIKQYQNGEIVKHRPKTPEESWILVDGKHPAIISEELFQAAQNRRGTVPRKHTEYSLQNPLAGLVRCECGSTMVLRKYSNARSRILCPKQVHCHNQSAVYADVESAVLDALRRNVEDLKIEYVSGDNAENNLNENLILGLKRELLELNKQQEKLYDLLERGIYSELVFLKRNAALAERRGTVDEAIRKAEAETKTAINAEEKMLSLKSAIDCIQSDALTAKQKNDFLKTIIKSISYARQSGEPFRLSVELWI